MLDNVHGTLIHYNRVICITYDTIIDTDKNIWEREWFSFLPCRKFMSNTSDSADCLSYVASVYFPAEAVEM